MMRKAREFSFLSYDYNEISRTATLKYCFDTGPRFEEQYTFHNAPVELSEEQRTALSYSLRQLHLAAGISYYKVYAPSKICVDNGPLSTSEARFFEKFYVKGLSEFAYRNGIDLHRRIHFQAKHNVQPESSKLVLKRRTAIPIGGGKDSIVSLEALKRAGEEIILISIGNAKPIQRVIRTAGVSSINVSRRMSENLFELNDQGALNGHIPVTGILSFVLATASILYGFDTILMSNERSANEGNLTIDGLIVNHQYSKSFEFEQDFSIHIKRCMLSNLNYFSFLRPLSELAIAKLFAKLQNYHSVFVSCNKAFGLKKGNQHESWCCNCPKCRFVFLALASFLNRSDLIKIFGDNLLNDGSQEKGYRELVGLEGHKPFECVGEILESRTALCSLSFNAHWRDTLIVENLVPEINNHDLYPKDRMDSFLDFSEQHELPARYRDILSEFVRSSWDAKEKR